MCSSIDRKTFNQLTMRISIGLARENVQFLFAYRDRETEIISYIFYILNTEDLFKRKIKDIVQHVKLNNLT